MFKQCFFTKALLMKTLVVLEFTKTCIVRDSEVLVVFKKVLQTLRALIVDQRGSFFFYLGQ